MKDTILIGKASESLSNFLISHFNCDQITFFDEKENKYKFDYIKLENIIYDNKVSHIIISDPILYNIIFLRYNFYDSGSLTYIKNIFIIPEKLDQLNDLFNFIPSSFIYDYRTIKKKDKVYKGGIIKKVKRTRDILYNFNPSFNFKVDNTILLFRKDKIKEEEFYIDYTFKNKLFSLISQLDMESFIPFISKVKGKATLFSNLELEENKEFYKYILEKEINR